MCKHVNSNAKFIVYCKIFIQKINIVFLALLLSRCASFTLTPSKRLQPQQVNHYLPWSQRKTQLNAIQNFCVGGHLAAHENIGHGVNASFRWKQMGDHYQLNFFGPIPTQSAVLIGNSQHVSLKTVQYTYQAKNPEQLLQHQLGLSLPASYFYYWLRGLPAPQFRYTMNLDAYNRVMQLRQSGWRIVYRHFTHFGDIDLPDQFDLFNGQWKIRVALNHWDIK